MAKPDAIRELERELRGCVNADRQPDYAKGLTKEEWAGMMNHTNPRGARRMIEAGIRDGSWIESRAFRKCGTGFRSHSVYRPKDNKKWAMYLAAFKEVDE